MTKEFVKTTPATPGLLNTSAYKSSIKLMCGQLREEVFILRMGGRIKKARPKARALHMS